MLAVDVLEVPMPAKEIVICWYFKPDYFTKWAEAIPMPDQTAERIVRVLVDIFSRFGISEILHSDFESTILKRTGEAFGIIKSMQNYRIPSTKRWYGPMFKQNSVKSLHSTAVRLGTSASTPALCLFLQLTTHQLI